MIFFKLLHSFSKKFLFWINDSEYSDNSLIICNKYFASLIQGELIELTVDLNGIFFLVTHKNGMVYCNVDLIFSFHYVQINF